MNCPYCGSEIPEESGFCPNCGAAVKAKQPDEPTEEQAAAAQPAEEQTSAAAPVTEADAPKKKFPIWIVLVGVILVCTAAIIVTLVLTRGGKTDPDQTDASNATDPTDVTDVTDATDSTGGEGSGSQIADDREQAYPDGFDYLGTDLDAYISLGKYKGMTVALTVSSEVTQADVQAYIDNVLSQYTGSQEITDRAVALGDTVNVNYTGKLDGVAFEGGTAENQTIVLGNGGFIDGFEDGIVGMTVGETRTINATFPDPYSPNSDLAGKTVQFDITLNSATEAVAPVYNDEFVKEAFDLDSTAAFEAAVLELLKDNRQSEILAEKQEACLAAASENATVLAYPEGLVEDYMQQQLDYIKYYAVLYGMSYKDLVEQAVGMTVEEYENNIRASAETAVKEELVIHAIAKAEGFTVTEEDFEAELAEFLEYYDYEDKATMCTDYGITEAYIDNTIHFSLAYSYALDKLIENTTFTGAK